MRPIRHMSPIGPVFPHCKMKKRSPDLPLPNLGVGWLARSSNTSALNKTRLRAVAFVCETVTQYTGKVEFWPTAVYSPRVLPREMLRSNQVLPSSHHITQPSYISLFCLCSNLNAYE